MAIHQPQMRTVELPKGRVNYMNSGDWIEHLSALEYVKGTWRLYQHEAPALEAQVARLQRTQEPAMA